MSTPSFTGSPPTTGGWSTTSTRILPGQKLITNPRGLQGNTKDDDDQGHRSASHARTSLTGFVKCAIAAAGEATRHRISIGSRTKAATSRRQSPNSVVVELDGELHYGVVVVGARLHAAHEHSVATVGSAAHRRRH